MESKNEFYLLAVVAIVAIVGIVVMIMGANKAPATANTVLGSDATGQAYASTCADCLNSCYFYGGDECMTQCSNLGYCARGASTR